MVFDFRNGVHGFHGRFLGRKSHNPHFFVEDDIMARQYLAEQSKKRIFTAEELDTLFEEIRQMILNQDEKSHNWNKNSVAGKVVNKWLIFKKRRTQNE